MKVSTHKLTTLYGALAFNIFYWYGAPNFVAAITSEPCPDAVKWALRAAVLALTAVWVLRGYQKEEQFQAEAAARAGGLSAAAGRSLARSRVMKSGAPEVTFADGTRAVAKPGATVLEVAEANGQSIEAGCRMGVCGADPIAIKDGMANLSPVSDDERSTLERLGHADNTRMACCCRVQGPVEVALTPDKKGAATPSQILRMSFDRSIERVVVLGNGIAGVTAADHVRRRHPECQVDLVADEPHPLYNRMGINRLIYGRSAMAGLYLNPDAWYEERRIETWACTCSRSVRSTGAFTLYFALPWLLPCAIWLAVFVRRSRMAQAAVGEGVIILAAALALSAPIQAAAGARGEFWFVAKLAFQRPLEDTPSMQEFVRWARKSLAGTADGRWPTGQKGCVSFGIAALVPNDIRPDEVLTTRADLRACDVLFLMRGDVQYAELSTRAEAEGFVRTSSKRNAEMWLVR